MSRISRERATTSGAVQEILVERVNKHTFSRGIGKKKRIKEKNVCCCVVFLLMMNKDMEACWWIYRYTGGYRKIKAAVVTCRGWS